MHARWNIFSPEAKTIFLHEQQVFSKEKFDSSKIELSYVDLSFVHGYQLVRAEIQPQRVELGDGVTAELGELHRSFFLYNRTTDDLVRKVVPLEPKAGSIYFVNGLLKVRVTAETAIDYAKYFGLIVESEEVEGQEHRESFFFMDHIDEIPWDDSSNTIARERLTGMLQALSPLKSDGHFEVSLKEEKSFWLGSLYRMTMPCIFKKSAFTVRLSVTPSGIVQMEEDFPLCQDTFKDLSATLPYYRLEPTGKLKALIQKRKSLNRIISVGYGLAFLVLVVLMLVGTAFAIVGLSEVVIGMFRTDWTNTVETFLRGHRHLLEFSVAGSFVTLLSSILMATLGWAAETIGRQRPGMLSELYASWRRGLRKRHETLPSRIKGLVSRTFWGWLVLFTTWGCIFYALHTSGMALFASPSQIDLRSSIAFTFDQAIGWFLRHPASYSSGPYASFMANFSHVQELSGLGKILKFIMLSSIPVLLIADIQRYWRFTKTEE